MPSPLFFLFWIWIIVAVVIFLYLITSLILSVDFGWYLFGKIPLPDIEAIKILHPDIEDFSKIKFSLHEIYPDIYNGRFIGMQFRYKYFVRDDGVIERDGVKSYSPASGYASCYKSILSLELRGLPTMLFICFISSALWFLVVFPIIYTCYDSWRRKEISD